MMCWLLSSKDVFDLVGTDQINSLNQAIEDVNYL